MKAILIWDTVGSGMNWKNIKESMSMINVSYVFVGKNRYLIFDPNIIILFLSSAL